MSERKKMSDEPRIVTAADMVSDDPSFCCPLIGAYPCEQQGRGCYCHELHLINCRWMMCKREEVERLRAELHSVHAHLQHYRNMLAAERERCARLYDELRGRSKSARNASQCSGEANNCDQGEGA